MTPQEYLEVLSVSLAQSQPAVAQRVATIRDLYNKRLWHELSLGLLALLESDDTVRAAAYDLHENVIARVRSHISPEVYAKILHLVCVALEEQSQGDDPATAKKALAVLDSGITTLQAQSRGQNAASGNAVAAYMVLAVRCLRALVLMSQGPSAEATRTMADIGEIVLGAGAASAAANAAAVATTAQAQPVSLTSPTADLTSPVAPAAGSAAAAGGIATGAAGVAALQQNPVLQAFYHRAAARQYELNLDYDSFYGTAFLFAEYSAAAGITIVPAELRAIAFKTAVAAFLSPALHNFGQLLTFPSFEDALAASTETAWALALLRICNRGDVDAFDAFAAIALGGNAGSNAGDAAAGGSALTADESALAHAARAVVSGSTEIADALRGTLRQKVRRMAVLDLVFRTPSAERTYTLARVAERCRLAKVSDVEPLLLTAMALHLIEGKIDGVDGTLDVTWLQPRVLQPAEVASCADAVAAWRKSVRGAIRLATDTTAMASAVTAAVNSAGILSKA
jgi:hypothetical protein